MVAPPTGPVVVNGDEVAPAKKADSVMVQPARFSTPEPRIEAEPPFTVSAVAPPSVRVLPVGTVSAEVSVNAPPAAEAVSTSDWLANTLAAEATVSTPEAPNAALPLTLLTPDSDTRPVIGVEANTTSPVFNEVVPKPAKVAEIVVVAEEVMSRLDAASTKVNDPAKVTAAVDEIDATAAAGTVAAVYDTESAPEVASVPCNVLELVTAKFTLVCTVVPLAMLSAPDTDSVELEVPDNTTVPVPAANVRLEILGAVAVMATVALPEAGPTTFTPKSELPATFTVLPLPSVTRPKPLYVAELVTAPPSATLEPATAKANAPFNETGPVPPIVAVVVPVTEPE